MKLWLPELWTPAQRRGIAAIFSIVIVIFGIGLAMNRATISDPQPARGAMADELADRLDPNFATAAELAAIPGLGEKRAATIVAYRDEFAAGHPGHLAFNKAADLENVRGIGPATMESLEGYLVFPADSSTQRSL